MMVYKNELYCLMNNKFMFLDSDCNETEQIEEAIGWKTIEEAKQERLLFDNPEEILIVKKEICMKVSEIIKESEVE